MNDNQRMMERVEIAVRERLSEAYAEGWGDCLTTITEASNSVDNFREKFDKSTVAKAFNSLSQEEEPEESKTNIEPEETEEEILSADGHTLEEFMKLAKADCSNVYLKDANKTTSYNNIDVLIEKIENGCERPLDNYYIKD